LRLATLVLTVSGGTLVQNTIVPILGVGGVVPDLPFVLVMLLALRRGAEIGCSVGFAVGLAQDAISGGPLGILALSRAVVGFAAGELPRLYLVANPLVPVLATGLASVADGVLRLLLLRLFDYPVLLHELFGSVILPQAGYNTVLAAFLVTLPRVWVRA
jgi:rod shape-determining protein MreD